MRVACCFFLLGVAAATNETVSEGAAKSLSCKSESGDNVDFAYSFKYPGGWKYAYMDAKTPLTKSSKMLTDSKSSIANTVMQMHAAGVSHVIFNDQPPEDEARSSSAPYAHSKGLLLFTKTGGVWLTHSLPKFPSTTETTAESLYKGAADSFGQSFLCITVKAAEIDKIASLLAVTRPTIYAKEFADGSDAYAALKAITEKPAKWDKATKEKTVSITSKGGQKFDVYGKSGTWGIGKDLYHDDLALTVGPLFMEGWRRGAGVWGPDCEPSEVLDILSVSYPGQDWNTGSDHSKWAITEELAGSTFCVGDLNRADGQDKRGGATVCIDNDEIHKEMLNVIHTHDKCNKTKAEKVLMV